MAINIQKSLIGLLFFFLCASITLAGPPFLSDDPVPVDYKHSQITIFSSTTDTDETNIQAPSIKLGYGIIPNLEINATILIATNIPHQHDDPSATGLGDLQLGSTFRFLQETDFLPQIAFIPTYFLPTGNSQRGLGNGRAYLSLPLWAQKSWKVWTLDFGGGYQLNPASGQWNNVFAGIVLQRNMNEKLTLGGEIYFQGATSAENPSTTIFNVGGTYNLTKQLSFLLSAGHSVIGMSDFVTYVGFQWNL
jgi:hypothetical protein